MMLGSKIKRSKTNVSLGDCASSYIPEILNNIPIATKKSQYKNELQPRFCCKFSFSCKLLNIIILCNDLAMFKHVLFSSKAF